MWGVQFHPESAGGPLDTMEVLCSFVLVFFGLTCAIQMFTDFVAECRAERLKSRVTRLSVDTSAIRQKKQPVLEEAPEPIAVAA